MIETHARRAARKDLTNPVVAGKEVTSDIAQAEEAATKLLESELDKSMQKFQAKNADFFGEYTNARMIIDLGERHEKTGDAEANP